LLKLINNYSYSFDVIYFSKGIIMSTTDFMSRISAAITLNQEAKKILGGISCNPSTPGSCELEAMNDALLGIPLAVGEFANEIGNGVKETLREEWDSLWDTVTNPIETVKETWAGLGEAVTNPRDTAVEAWENFKEPYVDDWTNGREGEAIGRGLTELGLSAIPGVGIVKVGKKSIDILGELGRDNDGNRNGDDRTPGFSDAENAVISETHSIMESPEMDRLREAHANGEPAEVKIGERTIVYSPDMPPNYSGMTLSGENGFTLGPRAFSSDKELTQTVLHENYRLSESEILSEGNSSTPSHVSEETDAAWEFSERAYEEAFNDHDN
jgi:hypothetical protein